MDSGASFHTTPSLELLSNYVPGKFGKVYLADGKSLDIIGRGDINIRTSNGSVCTLNNVRHIPTLKRNLISIGQLDDEGALHHLWRWTLEGNELEGNGR